MQRPPKEARRTDDPSEILQFACEAWESGIGCALVTLVDIYGGAARAVGAQMAVREDGLYCGFVSGGCTEAAVAAEAVAAISSGRDRFLRLGQGSPFFDIVLPCGGGIRLAIHVLRGVEALNRVLAEIAARRPAGLRYLPETEELAFGPAARPGWQDAAFAVRYLPPVRMVLGGGRLEVERTAMVAEAAGYGVDMLNGSDDDIELGGLDARTAVVLLHHDLHRELPLLLAALPSQAFYIGALGSTRTHARRVAALLEQGLAETEIARIRAPIGIFSRARDASSLALSVVADVAQISAGTLAD